MTLFPIRDGALFGLTNESGSTVVEPAYAMADRSVGGTSILVDEDDSITLYSIENAQMKHSPSFTTDEYTFSFGRLAVKQVTDGFDGPYGYLDVHGVLCIPCNFVEASPFDMSGAIVRCAKDELYFRRVSFEGEVSGCRYGSLRRFHPRGSMAGGRLERGDRNMVLVTSHGDVVGKQSYLEVWQEHENLIPVRFTESQIGWIDTQGSEVRRFNGSRIGNHFESGLVPVESDKRKWGLMNFDADWVVEPGFEFVEPVGPGRFLLGNENNGHREVRLADMCGHWIGQSTFKWIDYFVEGYAMVFREKDDESSEFNFVSMNGDLVLKSWN
jgi:hypothetical protein